MNESNSNSSTPSSEQFCKSPAKYTIDYSSLSEDNADTVASGREDNTADPFDSSADEKEHFGKPHSEDCDGGDLPPPMKRRCRQASGATTASSAVDLVAMVEHVNQTNPHFPAIIDDVRRMLQADSLLSAATHRGTLSPLMNLLGLCMEKGTGNAMCRLIEAIFANINSKKTVPLMGEFASKLSFNKDGVS